MPYMVREFKEIARLRLSKLSFPVSGRIDGDGYVLTAGKRVVTWPASEVGEDDKGRFAVLTPGDMFVDEKVLVRVEEEPDELHGYRDTAVTLRELADTTPYEQALWRNKIYPESVNLLMPAENSLCVL